MYNYSGKSILLQSYLSDDANIILLPKYPFFVVLQVFYDSVMFTYNRHGVIGSLLEPVPIITHIESKFDSTRAVKWLFEHYYVYFISAIVYLVLIYVGTKWMENRPAYKLQRPLLMWNTGLAVFSFLGSLSLIPQLFHGIGKHGFYFIACKANDLSNPHITLWLFLIVNSKVFELFDTAFIVLRKRPLQFLHWYHHITVMIYGWYCLSHSSPSLNHYGAAINFGIHTIMYSYYSVKSAGFYVPLKIAQFITVGQILQMFAGLFIVFFTFNKTVIQGLECEANSKMVAYLGMVIYGSYLILFLHFFYNRYLKPKEKKN